MVRTQLYTSGGEFNLPDGTNYVGAYHVHIDNGAMVGGFHKTEAHDRLTPSNAAARSKVRSIQQELSNEAAANRRNTRRPRTASYSPASTASSGSSGSSGY